MSTATKLPDFIDVANIKDLFWNNNSDLYPTCVPSEYITIEKTRPTFLSPYLGTCVLRGEYNHCIFNGTYYFLTKLRVLDIMSEEYEYQLDYDVMINFLNKGANIKGTLIKTNKEDILEECLQTTVPILADPIDRKTYGLKESEKQKWTDNLRIEVPLDNRKVFELISEPTITRENYTAFIRRVENHALARATKDKEWLAKNDPNLGWNYYAQQNPLFVLDSIPLENRPVWWKAVLIDRFFSWIYNAHRHIDLVITKQTTPSDHFNVGGYVLGEKDKTLGSNIASEVYLKDLDFSNFYDIVPINNKTGEKLEPTRDPSYSLLTHGSKITTNTSIFALLRNPYLPIGNEKGVDGCIPPDGNTLVNYCQKDLFKGNNAPQQIETKSGDIGYLWYLNKNNLALVEEFNSEARKNAGGKLTNSTWTGERTRWGFFRADYKNVAPLGFLIYQLWKPYSEWNDLEYIGEGTHRLLIRTGLSADNINTFYSNHSYKYWWGTANEALLDLWGNSKVLSRLFLDIDEFNWLSIAPSDKGRTYKYHSEDYWGYKEFFPSAGNVQWYYPSVLNRMYIEWAGGNVETPYSYGQVNVALPGWIERRDKKIRDVSILNFIELDGELTKGDLLTTNLEHSWYEIDSFSLGLFPYKLTAETWVDIINKLNERQLIDRDFDAEIRDKLQELQTLKGVHGTSMGIGILALILLGISVASGGTLAPLGLAALGASLTSVGVGIAGVTIPVQIGERLKPDAINNLINVGIYSKKAENQTPFQDRAIVFYLYQGKYRIGIYKKKSRTINLHDGEDNLIKSVDGTTTKDLDISLIHPLEHGELDFNNETVLGDDIKNEIIQYGLGQGEFIPGRKYHNYTFDDLKVGTHTFDLVGTDWYLVVHNDTFNLVAKKNSVWETIKDEGQSFEIKEHVSTFSKINQKASLNYYGQRYPLNTKFNFKGIEREAEGAPNTNPTGLFTYSSKPIILENQYADPDVEYKILGVSLPNDDINVIATIPRKETRAAETVDSTQVLMMKERLLQQNMNYEQDKYANELMINDKRQAMARQREDMDHNWYRAVAGIAAQSISTVGSIVGGAATGGLSGALTGGLETMKGVGSLALGAGVDFLIRYPTLMKRIDENERDMLLANSQQLYQRRQNYEHDFRFQTLKLNKVAGSYQKPSVTNRDAQEVYNKTIGVGNTYVEVLLPSVEQQKQIDHIYETFGCECISDRFVDTPFAIYSGMSPGLYKFSKIESGGITSLITDTTLRDILRQVLENGVKFSGCHIEVSHTPPTTYIRVPKSRVKPKVVFTTDDIKDWALDKWDTYKLQTDKKEIIDTLKKLPHYGLTDQEWEKHKDSFKDIDDDTLLALINQIINGRESGESIVIQLPKRPPTEADVEHLKQTINTLKTEVSNLQEQIDSNRQICEATQQQLEEEKRALQTQLTECQQRHTEITKDKETKEGQITIIQGQINALTLEKLELEKQLKECKDQIKRLVAAQKLCDQINTAEIKRLKDELEKCKQEKDTLTKSLTSTNEQLEQRKLELETCSAAQNACEDKLTNLNKQIADLQAKVKELELRPTAAEVLALHAEIQKKREELKQLQLRYDAEKSELEKDKKALNDKQKELEAEIHQHKVDKEELEQKLNDERRRAINEKDEINKLKKEIEDSKGDKDKISELEEKIKEIELEKATCDERIAAKNRELEQCRTELDLAKKAQPKKHYIPQVADECTLWQSILRDPYQYELKARENGWDAFLDLVFELAQILTWEGRTDIDQKLFKVTEVRPILEKLEELKNVPIIDKAIDMMKAEGWPVFLEYIQKGGDINGRIPKVVEKFNAIKLMETTPTVHSVKALLDELNWLSFKAKGQLAEQLKTNEDLQTLYAHIYPGTKTIDLYKALFGDPKWAIIRKRFTEEFKCTGEGGGSMVEWADSYRKTTDYVTTDIKKPEPKPAAEVKPEEPKEPAKPSEIQIRIKRGLVFKPTDNQPYRQLRNLIPSVNEAVKGWWRSESKTDYTWLIWNYFYSRYFKGGYTKYNMIWLKQRVGSAEQQGRYILDYHYPDDYPNSMFNRVRELWNRRKEYDLTKVVNGIRNGTITMTLHMYGVPTFQYDTKWYTFNCPPELIADIDALGVLDDFVKLSQILDYNRCYFDTGGREHSDNYRVYRPSVHTGGSIESFKNIDQEYFIKDKKWFWHTGWLFPFECVLGDGGWYNVYGNPTTNVSYNEDSYLYQYIRWFYEITIGGKQFYHPWEIGAGGAAEFMRYLRLINRRQ